MKTFLLDCKKKIFLVFGIVLLILLSACRQADDLSGLDVQQAQSETVESDKTAEVELPSFDDYEGYIELISDIPSFEPYYQTAFDFEGLSGGVASVPLEDVKAMYNEMNNVFDYILLSDYPLYYRGHYDGETSFVEGYEEYQSAHADMQISSPINFTSKDWEGNEYFSTPLKTVLLGDNIFHHFDNSIETGRNLQLSDFTLASPTDPIRVVLGHAYTEIFELGDVFTLELISEEMNFQVVGFYKPEVGFSMDLAAQEQINFDHTIVMPHFIPDYEPVGEAAVYQHAFHLAELTSGYIGISELTEDISDETYDDTVAVLEEMAKQHNLSDLYRVGYWPMGFVW